MKYKFYFVIGMCVISSFAFAKTQSSTTSKEVETGSSASLSGPYDSKNYFEVKRRATEFHIKDLQELADKTKEFVDKHVVNTINSSLYGVGPEGNPAPGQINVEISTKHAIFCSPLSGYETGMFASLCNKKNSIALQHADIKPLFISENKLDMDMVSITENWINNVLTPLDFNLPDYVRNPALLNNTKNLQSFVDGLLEMMPLANVATVLNIMLARRIPNDPKDKDSPSLASSLADEVNGRHLNIDWHEAIAKSTNDLDITKEQLRLLALISYQIQELNERLERVELLNASLVTVMVNQQKIMDQLFKVNVRHAKATITP